MKPVARAACENQLLEPRENSFLQRLQDALHHDRGELVVNVGWRRDDGWRVQRIRQVTCAECLAPAAAPAALDEARRRPEVKQVTEEGAILR